MDNIFALSSGGLPSGVAIVRLSGPNAGDAVQKLCGQTPHARHMRLTDLRDPKSGELIDRGLMLWMPGPKSFTGEDCAEFQIHGGLAVIDRLCNILAQMPDMRIAQPGEFMRRAFANQRMDIIEVEGVADLIAAQTAEQHRVALRASSGQASERVENWRQQLISCMARVEAAIDFIDEDGVAEEALLIISDRIAALHKDLCVELEAMHWNERLRDGFTIAIAGPTNAGKSSLLNWLARREAAIVSPYAGTTRDLVEVHLDITGVPVTIVDTAGLRDDSNDEIEKIGMAKAYNAMEKADLILWVGAPDIPVTALPEKIDSDVLWLWNKSDTSGPSTEALVFAKQNKSEWREISVTQERGVNELLGVITERLQQGFNMRESSMFSRVRQRQAINDCSDALKTVLDEPDLPLELMVEHLRRAGQALARLTGRIDVEDLLDEIFAQFCVGK